MKLLLAITFCYAVLACTNRNGKTCIKLVNNCQFKVWPGIIGPGIRENERASPLTPGLSRDVFVPDRWNNGKIWGRTGCDGNMMCDTGFCKGKVQCNDAPVSVAEFSLGMFSGDGANQDIYEVTLADGYNLPLSIEPIRGTYKSIGGKTDCKRAGGCAQSLNVTNICPQELQYRNRRGAVVGCKSACQRVDADQFCCRNGNATEGLCNPALWPQAYPSMMRRECKAAYNYALDDKTSTFACRGRKTISSAYKVQFC